MTAKRQPPTIDAEYEWFMSTQEDCEAPPMRKPKGPTIRQRWASASISHALIAVFLVGCVLPWLILIGGIVALEAWDALTATG